MISNNFHKNIRS